MVVDFSRRREIRALDVVEEVFNAEIGVESGVVNVAFNLRLLDNGEGGINQFGKVVRRDISCHSDGDTGTAVEKKVGDGRRQD